MFCLMKILTVISAKLSEFCMLPFYLSSVLDREHLKYQASCGLPSRIPSLKSLSPATYLLFNLQCQLPDQGWPHC